MLESLVALPILVHRGGPWTDDPVSRSGSVIADLVEKRRGELKVFKTRLLDKLSGDLAMLGHVERLTRRVVEEGEEFTLPKVHRLQFEESGGQGHHKPCSADH